MTSSCSFGFVNVILPRENHYGFLNVQLHCTINLQKQIQVAVDLDCVIRAVHQSSEFRKKEEQLKQQLANARKTLKRSQMLYNSLYENYVDHLMTEDEYISMKGKYKKQIDETRQSIEELNQEILTLKKYTEENPFLHNFLQFQGAEQLSRDLLTSLVDRIYVGAEGTVEIFFKFQDEYRNLTDYLNGRNTACGL